MDKELSKYIDSKELEAIKRETRQVFIKIHAVSLGASVSTGIFLLMLPINGAIVALGTILSGHIAGRLYIRQLKKKDELKNGV